MVVVDVVGRLIVRTVVTILSHPIELTNVSIYVPETVYKLDPTIILSPKQIENDKFENILGHKHVSVSVKV